MLILAEHASPSTPKGSPGKDNPRSPPQAPRPGRSQPERAAAIEARQRIAQLLPSRLFKSGRKRKEREEAGERRARYLRARQEFSPPGRARTASAERAPRPAPTDSPNTSLAWDYFEPGGTFASIPRDSGIGGESTRRYSRRSGSLPDIGTLIRGSTIREEEEESTRASEPTPRRDSDTTALDRALARLVVSTATSTESLDEMATPPGGAAGGGTGDAGADNPIGDNVNVNVPHVPIIDFNVPPLYVQDPCDVRNTTDAAMLGRLRLRRGRNRKTVFDCISVLYHAAVSKSTTSLAAGVESLKAALQLFTDNHTKVLDGVEDDEYEREEAYGTAVTWLANAWIRHGGEKIDEYKIPPRRAKLPDLKLTPFKGELAAWPGWWESFTTTIDQRPDLPEADKLNYLKHYVTGSAAGTVQAFIGAGQYESAKEALVARYHNPKELLQLLVLKLQRREKCAATLASIQDLLDSTFSTVEILKKAEHTDHEMALMLITPLLDKLPDKMQREWAAQEAKETTMSMDRFIEFLRERLKMELTLTGVKGKGGTEGATAKRAATPTAAFLGATAGPAPSGDRCLVCKDQGHVVPNCPVFNQASVSERREMAGRMRLCYRCLGAAHMARWCKYGKKCSTCKKQSHHTLLHVDGQTAKSKKKSLKSK